MDKALKRKDRPQRIIPQKKSKQASKQESSSKPEVVKKDIKKSNQNY